MLKLKSESSVNVSEQRFCHKVTIVSFSCQDEVVTTVVVAVVGLVWKKVLQDVMLV